MGRSVNVSDAVKLFFRRANHNAVVSHRWLQRNDTRLHVFGQSNSHSLSLPVIHVRHVQRSTACSRRRRRQLFLII